MAPSTVELNRPMVSEQRCAHQLRGAALWAVGASLGAVFIWSGIPKILQPYEFFLNVKAYHLVSPALAAMVTMFLPWLELLVGFCLIAGLWQRGAGAVALALSVLFVFVNLSAMWRGLDISCGCFGGSGRVGALSLMRAALILAAALSVAWMGRRGLPRRSAAPSVTPS